MNMSTLAIAAALGDKKAAELRKVLSHKVDDLWQQEDN